MSASVTYSEGQLHTDKQEMVSCFRDTFNREISRIRENLSTDYRVPREGWDVPYQGIVRMCRRMGRDPHALTAAMVDVQNALEALKDTAECEMVELQSQVATAVQSMDQVKKDPVRDYQRELRHATRSMDREEIKAAAQEKSLVSSITKLAKEQRLDLCKAKAKELVRLRAHRHRLVTMKGHMATLQQQLSTVQSAKVMQETMAKTTHLLRSLNSRLDAKSIHRMLMEFERQSTSFADGQQVLEETLDGIFETDEEQSNTDEAIAGVFQELGLELQIGLAMSRDRRDACPADDNDIMARLEKLKAQE